MTTKEYLGQMRNIDNRINDKIEESEKWMMIAKGTGLSMSEDRVQTSPKYDRMGDAVALAVDYEKESGELAADLAKLKHRIIEQIDGIGNELYYNILKTHYIKQKSLAETSYILHYSYKQLKRHYEEAISEFEKIYGQEYLLECPIMSTNVH